MKQLSLPTGAPDLHPVVSRSLIERIIRDAARSRGLGGPIQRGLIEQCGALSNFDISASQSSPGGGGGYGLFLITEEEAKKLKLNRYDWRDNIVAGVTRMLK